MIAQYADLQSEAMRVWEARQYRRRRLLSCVRGYLLRSCRPRLLTALALLVGAAAGGVLGSAASRWLGLSWPLGIAFGSVVAWLVFVYVCWRSATALSERADLMKDFESNMGADEEFLAKYYFGNPASETNSWKSEIKEAFARELGRAAGNAGIIGLLILGLLTGGTWVVWQLICYGPELLAEIALDGGIAVRRVSVQRIVATGPWKANALLASGMFFLTLAVILILLVATISCIPTQGWGRVG